MDTTAYGLRPLLDSSHPTNPLILILLGTALLLFLALVYLPLITRWIGLWRLERKLRGLSKDHSAQPNSHRDQLTTAFENSAVANQWSEFHERWTQSQSFSSQDAVPIHFAKILQQSPLLPHGIRRTALQALPALSIALGILGGMYSLSVALESPADTLNPTSIATAIASALHIPLWGLGLAICTGIADRLLRASFQHYTESFDHYISSAFPTVSDDEWTSNLAHRQAQWMDRFRMELAHFNTGLAESIDRGLQRIEVSTASAANLVSEEQRQALQNIIAELSTQMQRGTEEHLLTLSEIMAQAIDHQGAVTSGLADGFQQMAENARVQKNVAESLAKTTTSVGATAEYLDQVCLKISPVLADLGEASQSLHKTATTMHATQQVIDRSADAIRISLEQSASSMSDQHEFIESSLGEVRATLGELSSSLGEKLSQSLRNIDGSLEATVGRLRDTLNESNETIHRMAEPIRAAEETTRAMQNALENAQADISGIRNWLGGAIQPVRTTLTQLNDRTLDVTRALAQFGDNASGVDRSISALRDEIREEGRRFRQSSAELGRNLQRTTEAMAARHPSDSSAAPIAILPDSLPERPPRVNAPSNREASPPAPIDESNLSGDTTRPMLSPASEFSLSELQRSQTASDLRPETAGRWLGPDPYARKTTEADGDLERSQRLLDAYGPMSLQDDLANLTPNYPLTDSPNRLSGLLGRSDDTTDESDSQATSDDPSDKEREQSADPKAQATLTQSARDELDGTWDHTPPRPIE